MVPVFALVYLVVGAVPTSAIYIQRWADFYESVAMASYFLLLVAYVCPVAEQREGFFDNLPHQGGPSSLAWYRVSTFHIESLAAITALRFMIPSTDNESPQQRTWFFVFQYIPVSFLCAVATDITQAVGVYCENSSKAYFAHIWVCRPFSILCSSNIELTFPSTVIQITVIRSISVALAFIRLFAFFKRLHQPLKQHHIASKLTAIKGIIFLTWVQSVSHTLPMSSFATDHSPFHTTIVSTDLPSPLLDSLHNPNLPIPRPPQRQTLLRRHLLRHPIHPHLQLHGALRRLPLLRLQRSPLHSQYPRQRRDALPGRSVWLSCFCDGGKSYGDSGRSGDDGWVCFGWKGTWVGRTQKWYTFDGGGLPSKGWSVKWAREARPCGCC